MTQQLFRAQAALVSLVVVLSACASTRTSRKDVPIAKITTSRYTVDVLTSGPVDTFDVYDAEGFVVGKNVTVVELATFYPQVFGAYLAGDSKAVGAQPEGPPTTNPE